MNNTQIQEAFVRAEELRQNLLHDSGGAYAKQMMRYFRHAELAARAMQRDAISPSEQGMAGDIADAFVASGQLVAEVWQSTHGQALEWSEQESRL